MTDAQLYSAIMALPPDLKGEAMEFIEFLRSKTKPQLNSRQLGCAKGLIELALDFDEPLDSFNAHPNRQDQHS